MEEESKMLKKEAEANRLQDSEEMSNRRFIKEYAKVMQHMEYHEDNFKADDPDQMLTFGQMGGILTTMGFISSELQSGQDDFKLVKELY